MTYPKMKPCWNCRSESVDVYEYDSGSKRAECDVCHASSGCFGRTLDAIRDWNKRFLSSSGDRPIKTAPREVDQEIWLYPCEFEDGPAWVKGHWYVHPSVQGWVTPELDCNDYEFKPTLWRPLDDPPTSGFESQENKDER